MPQPGAVTLDIVLDKHQSVFSGLAHASTRKPPAIVRREIEQIALRKRQRALEWEAETGENLLEDDAEMPGPSAKYLRHV